MEGGRGCREACIGQSEPIPTQATPSNTQHGPLFPSHPQHTLVKNCLQDGSRNVCAQVAYPEVSGRVAGLHGILARIGVHRRPVRVRGLLLQGRLLLAVGGAVPEAARAGGGIRGCHGPETLGVAGLGTSRGPAG